MKLFKVNEDKRGQIYTLAGFKTFPEVAMLITKKGYSRGGCVHNIHDEFVTVLEGEVYYYVGEERKFLKLQQGDNITIPKATPHYLYSVTDSTILEWGATLEEKNTKHKEFREIVNKINERKRLYRGM